MNDYPEFDTLAEAKLAADNTPVDLFSLYRACYEKPNGKFTFATSLNNYPIVPALEGRWVMVAEKWVGIPHVESKWTACEVSQDAKTQFWLRAGRGSN